MRSVQPVDAVKTPEWFARGSTAVDSARPGRSVLVEVALVRRVAAAVVHVVDMITMRDRHVSATLAVDVVMAFVCAVLRRLALIEMSVVSPVEVPVVDVVHMISVGDRDMAAARFVNVGVIGVLLVYCRGHRTSSCRIAQSRREVILSNAHNIPHYRAEC